MTPHLPPNYASHDRVYQRLRAQGATGWDDDESGTYADMLALVMPLLPSLGDGASPSVLEMGCGAGNFSLRLAQHNYRVTGVDIAPTAIDWAQERAQAATGILDFRVDNVLSLVTCGDAVFDAVVDGHCLHCIIGDDRTCCLAAVRRVLKPGGVFVVLSMCGEVACQKMLQVFDPLSKVTMHDHRPTRYIGSAGDIAAEVVSAGFAIRASRVVARKDSEDLDTLLICAIKPGA
jgi:SAM-dependent methyltransferase